MALSLRLAAGRRYCRDAPEAGALAANAELIGRHGDRSAVILGSGPSLALTNGEILADRVVIALNESFLVLERMGLRADYHVLIDMTYFADQPKSRRLLGDLAAVCRRTGAALVVDARARPLMEAIREQWPDVPVYYLRQVGSLAEMAELNVAPPLDPCAPLPEFACVLQAAFTLTLIMGCPEITLLGQEYDAFRTPDAPAPQAYGTSPYFPTVGSLLGALGLDLAGFLGKTAAELAGLRHLARHARLLGRTVVNLTPESALDMFDRRKISSTNN